MCSPFRPISIIIIALIYLITSIPITSVQSPGSHRSVVGMQWLLLCVTIDIKPSIVKNLHDVLLVPHILTIMWSPCLSRWSHVVQHNDVWYRFASSCLLLPISLQVSRRFDKELFQLLFSQVADAPAQEDAWILLLPFIALHCGLVNEGYLAEPFL